MSLLYFLVQQMMLFSIPLLIVALGGMFCERSGVINIALEGIMVLGGFAGILFINLFQGVLPGQPILLIALLISMVTGMVVSLVHAYASVNMKANQSISGTAINMFAPAFAIFVARVIRNVQQIPFENQFRIEKVPVLGDIPVIGGMFFQNAYITTYLGILILVVSCVVLYKTRFGLRLRSCGEHPQAAASVGISVYKMRYMGVLISGGWYWRTGIHHSYFYQFQCICIRIWIPGPGCFDLRSVETWKDPFSSSVFWYHEDHIFCILRNSDSCRFWHSKQYL